MNQKVIRSVFTVVAFWWIVFAVWGILRGDEEWSISYETTGILLIMLAWSVIAGPVMVWLNIWTNKMVQRAQLESTNVRGLTSTIGNVPMIAPEPKQSEHLPALDRIRDVPPNWYQSWLEKYDKTHPGHAELMRCFLRIYQHYAHLPATHIEGGHGSRSLLEHSLLAGYYIEKLGRTWRYTGLRDRKGKRIILKLRDQDYVFNPDDPLIALLGVAHDIGKIEAYIHDKSGRIVGIHHEHDLTGGRMIARIPAAWKIPDEDRRALFLAIAHYHHPMELPLSPDRRASDDRTIALMELLIKADFVVSRIEAGEAVPSDSDIENSATSLDLASDAAPDRLVKAFQDIIGEHSRINSSDRRFSVGVLCDGKGFAKPMLLINEASMRSAIVQRLQLGEQMPLGDRRYQLTIDLLKALDDKGFLYKKHDDTEYSAENAIWNIDFFARSENGGEAEKKTGWPAVIIVDPKIHPKVEQIEPYWWYAIIARGTMGSARRMNKTDSVINRHRNKKTTDLSGDEEVVAAALREAGQSFSALSSFKEPIEEVEETDQVTHAPNVVDIVKQSTPGPRADVSSQTLPEQGGVTKVEAHQITPLLIKTAIANVISLARSGPAAGYVTEHAGQYVMSTRQLEQLLPQIEWKKYRYQIETFCASGTLEAQVVEEADGHFVIAVRTEAAQTS